MKNTEAKTEVKETEMIYDADATQKIPIDEGVYAVVKPYSDERYEQYRTAFVKAINEMTKRGETERFEEAEVKQAIEMDCELCDELLENIEGYPDLPGDWKQEISAEDKLELIRKALHFVIDEDARKFSLGATMTIPTACFFNGKVARQKHNLRRKTIDDSSRYALLKSKEFKVSEAKRLGKNHAVEFTPQDEAKVRLYDEMLQSIEGFRNDKVPSRVKILVIDYVFAASIAAKK